MEGIDVSKHQGKIDWEKAKKDGIKYAIIRAGYGKNTIDKFFEANINGCIRNGIRIGVYWFVYAINEQEAVENAEMCHSVIEKYKDKISMRVWCDLEYDTDYNAKKRGYALDRETRTNMVISFCERLKKYGYEVGNYANPDYLKTKFNSYALKAYPLWLAGYSISEETAKSYSPFMWQFTSKGKVSGIKGNVDMNICYGTLTEKAYKGLEDYANEVINGKHGSGHANRKASLMANGCPYSYEEVRNKVNELCNNTQYYSKYKGNPAKIDVVFKSIGVPSKHIGSWAKRKAVANANGIKLYVGSGKQNEQLIRLAQQGKLKKV